MRRCRVLFAAALAGPALTATAASASAQDAVTSLLRPHTPAAAASAAAPRRAGRATPCARESQASRPGVGGVASAPLQLAGSGAGEYAKFLPQATDTPSTSATNTPAMSAAANPNRAQRPAPGTAIPAWADRPLYAETARPLWDAGEGGKRNGAETRGRRADPIPPGQRLASGADRRLWNPGESARPGGGDTSGQADAQPTDPTQAISIDPPLWNEGSSVARSPAPCDRGGETAGPDTGGTIR